MLLSAGERLGPYEILAAIGAGGMGTVYRARDTRLGREVAIKVSPERFSDRFEREAHAIAALNHPNICTLHDVGPNYLVMELVEGPALSDRIKEGAVPLEEALRIARQIAEALEAAHEKGIVHRDLKPGNIKLTADGEVKVLDFGLAKLAEPGMSEASPDESPTVTLAHATQTGAIMGTAAYMAPEQARGTAVDRRADIWAFGVICWEMLSGKRLFKGETISDTLASVLTRDPEWNALPATTPPRICALLHRCLERDRKLRLQAIGEARIAIDAPEAASPVIAASSQSAALRWWWWPVAAIAAAILFFAGWRMHAPEAAALPWRVTRLTADSGLSDAAALSPDGKLVAYSSDRGLSGERDLYIRQTGGGQAIQLTSDGAGNTAPDFSPDGTKIVFQSSRDGGGIYEIPAFGGEARQVAREGVDPKYSPDGTQVAYWIGSRGIDSRVPGSGAVWVAALGGGSPQRVGPNFTAARRPVWSPDGKHLLLVGYVSPKAYQDSAIDWWLVPLGPGAAVKTGMTDVVVRSGLSTSGVSSATPQRTVPLPDCWLAGSNSVIFSAITGDSTNLWQVPITAGGKITAEPSRLTAGAGNETNAACSGKGTFAFTNLGIERDIWSLPMDLNRGTPKSALDRITQGPVNHEHAFLSPSGRLLAFSSDQSGRQNIWIRDLTNGKESSVAGSAYIERFPVVSPSARRVAYSVYLKDNRAVYVGAPGSAPEKLCEGCLRATDWSNDEKSLLTFGGDPYQVNVLDLASHRETPLLKHAQYNLLYARFSADNRWVSFTARTGPNRGFIAIAPLEGSKPIAESAWVRITDSSPEDWANWSPDGRTLYFTSSRDGHSCLWAQRLEAGSFRPQGMPFAVQHFHGRIFYNLGGWSAGGDRIALVLTEQTGNIWLMSAR